MASLQPGVLAKLLEHAGTGTKVAGEHRTTLLQVVGVVPRGDDPFLAGGACPGFLLRVSDSFHAAYVAVAGEDAELVADDRVGVGQFVRVAGLDLVAGEAVAGEAVPVLRGVSPLPRRRPCVGDPVDLVVSHSLRKSPPFAGAKKPPTSPGAKMSPHFVGAKKSTPFSEVKPRRRSMENGEAERKETRRLSLDLSSKKALDGRLKKTNVGKDESPSLKVVSEMKKKGLRSTLSAKAQPCGRSPSKKVKTKRSSSPVKVNTKSSCSPVKVKTKSSCSPAKVKTKSSSISSCSFASKTLAKGEKEDANGSSPIAKVHVTPKSWDSSIPWDSLPNNLAALGKGSIRQRQAAFSVATIALQQAAASETVLRSLSVFADLCEPTRKSSLQSLIERFLTLYADLQQAADVLDAMLKFRDYGAKLGSNITLQLPSADDKSLLSSRKSSAAAWIDAALETDLSPFTLFRKQSKNLLTLKTNQHYSLVLETHFAPRKSKSTSCNLSSGPKEHHCPTLPTKQVVPSRRNGVINKFEWLKEDGLKETTSLCKLLLSYSRDWFLKLLEDEFDKGCGNKEVEVLGISRILGQLKIVNKWLEDATGEKFEVDASVERVRKKLYKFLLEHVDSSGSSSIDDQTN